MVGEQPSSLPAPAPSGLFDEGTTVANSSVAIRMGFIRKVYGILTVMLMVSLAFIAVCQYNEDVRSYVQSNPGTCLHRPPVLETASHFRLCGVLSRSVALMCKQNHHSFYRSARSFLM